MDKKIKILDSTLRDGAQGEGISFSVEDKLGIAIALDGLGISYIEAGNPGSNPKDMEFIARASKLKLKHSKIAAFCSTRRKNISAKDDDSIKSAVESCAQVIVVVGKSSEFHVKEILGAELSENLLMIQDTIEYLKAQGREVIFDAEHFFDGYKENPDYALSTVISAAKGGANCVTLCDTNGGTLPEEIAQIVGAVEKSVDVALGIHCHDDSGCAVANSLAAVGAGVRHVQGTYLGFGERCGNANLSAIIPNLQLKMGYECIPWDCIQRMSVAAVYVADIANITLSGSLPYVGSSAFAHKGGMHTDGVLKAAKSFEHIDPTIVGNYRRFLASEMAGRAAIFHKIKSMNFKIDKDDPVIGGILRELKEMEFDGWQFESADASFELLVRRFTGQFTKHFDLMQYKTMSEQPYSAGNSAFAAIKVRVGDMIEMTAAEGNGPINAIDMALRKSLEVFYPSLSKVHLIDYKVRVLDQKGATGAKVRVLITSSDGKRNWTTVGVSFDIIEASWLALVDSIEYKLLIDDSTNED